MSTNRAKYYDDPNIWGAKNNAFQDALKKGEYIKLAANGNEVPTVKQYTRFSWYNTEAITINNAAVTGDSEYSAGASITNPISEAIFEDSADVTLTWGDTIRGETLPSISDNTWYIYCNGGYDNSSTTIGQGAYNVTTSAPSYDYQKGGFYQGTNRVIGQFTVAASVVSGIIEYNEINDSLYFNSDNDILTKTKINISENIELGLYTGLGVDFNGSTYIRMNPYKVRCGEYLYESSSAANVVDLTSLSSDTWYVVAMKESDGTISNFNASSGWDNWTNSSSINQLNMASIYDEDYDYCRDSISSVFYRLLGIFKTNSTLDDTDYCINIKNYPKTIVECTSTLGTKTFADSTGVVIDYENINIDTNSEVTTGASWRYTANGTKKIMYASSVGLQSSSWSSGSSLNFFTNVYNSGGTSVRDVSYRPHVHATVTIALTSFHSVPFSIGKDYYIEPKLNQNSGSTKTQSASASANYINIYEI